MKKFFDSRRELVGSGPGSGVGGGGGAGSGGGGSFIGRVFTIGRYQVTVEEIVAEGKLRGFLWSGSKRVTQTHVVCIHSSTCTLLYGSRIIS